MKMGWHKNILAESSTLWNEKKLIINNIDET